MRRECIPIPGGTIILSGFASDHVGEMRDPYIEGLLSRKSRAVIKFTHRKRSLQKWEKRA